MEMTANELITRVAQIMHRADLGAQLPNWVADATRRINRRFGIELPVPVNGDVLPVGTEDLFLWAALTQGYEHLNNGDNAKYYDQKWELEADRQNVLSPGSVTDNYAAAPPFIAGV
jgi:hypothetical protein